MRDTLVVGLGHPDRGDDAIGGLVAAEVARRRPDLDVRSMADPSSLIDLIGDHRCVVVVDAAWLPERLGDVEVFDVSEQPLPELVAGAPSTHGLSLATVLGLCREAGTLPETLAVVAIGGGSWQVGASPQPKVAAALEPAARTVLDLVALSGLSG